MYPEEGADCTDAFLGMMTCSAASLLVMYHLFWCPAPCILKSVRGVQFAGAAVEARGVGGAAAEDHKRHAVQVLQAGGVRLARLRDGPLTGRSTKEQPAVYSPCIQLSSSGSSGGTGSSSNSLVGEHGLPAANIAGLAGPLPSCHIVVAKMPLAAAWLNSVWSSDYSKQRVWTFIIIAGGFVAT